MHLNSVGSDVTGYFQSLISSLLSPCALPDLEIENVLSGTDVASNLTYGGARTSHLPNSGFLDFSFFTSLSRPSFLTRPVAAAWREERKEDVK